MPNDLKIPFVAKVDVKRVSLTPKESLGIDFSNEIDLWAKMEFRARKQVNRLKSNNAFTVHDSVQDLRSLVYAVREKID